MSNHIKKVAFFGGTFDPIHFGHLNLAISMKEYFALDLVLFSVTPCNPFKFENPPVASLDERSKMIQKAIADIEGFDLIDVESKSNKISFTIDALKVVKEKYLNCKLFLVISNEMLKDFNKWKNSSEILQIADILVGMRNYEFDKSEIKVDIPKKNFIKTPIFEISASKIRERIKNNLYCAHLLPTKVLEYIQENGLYRS